MQNKKNIKVFNKIIISLIVLLIGIVCFSSNETKAATETVDGIVWTYTPSASKATNVYSTGIAGVENVVVPETLGGYPVVSVGGNSSSKNLVGASAVNTAIKTVTLPSTVTTINQFAFNNLKGLTSVTGGAVTSIGASSFKNCVAMDEVFIPSTVTSVGNYAFSGCTKFANITVPSYVTSWGTYVFEKCVTLTEVTFAEGVTSVGSYMFNSCTRLATINWASTITIIKDNAFLGCTGLKGTLTIPNGVKTIGIAAFKNCTGFTGSLILPDGLTTISNDAFRSCSGFTGDLVIPNSVTSMGTYAFYGCKGFNGTLTLSNQLTTISANTFQNCSGFTGDLVLPEKLVSIDSNAFQGCTGFNGQLRASGNSLATIGSNAFRGCLGFTKVILPGSIRSIGTNVFNNYTECPIKDIWINAENGASISFTNNWGGSNIPVVHYLNCKHSLVFGEMEGIKFVNPDTNAELVSGVYDCETVHKIKIVVDPSINKDNLKIMRHLEGEYANSLDTYDEITDFDQVFEITSLLRDNEFIVKNIKNGLDLNLRTFIVTVNKNQPLIGRNPVVSLSGALARFSHTKYPLTVKTGDIIKYGISIYNEGKLAGSVDEITYHLPEGLEFIIDDTVNTQYGWQVSEDGRTITTRYFEGEELLAYTGIGLLPTKYLEIVCKVTAEMDETKIVRLTNVAEISESTPADADSIPGNWSASDLSTYMKDEAFASNSASYVMGQEDDDDFENVIILRKIPITYTLKISKVDTDSLELINGAKFNLLNAKGEIIESKVIVENGTLTFSPITTIDEGTDIYYIVEAETPVGYQAVFDGRIKVKVIKTITDRITESYKIEVVCDMIEAIVNSRLDEAGSVPIYTREQLAKVGSGVTMEINGSDYDLLPSVNYKLMADIDLSDSEWTPITANVSGLFDGKNHTISGLKITDKSIKNAGLFAEFSGVIKDLNMDNVVINIDCSEELADIRSTTANPGETATELEDRIESLLANFAETYKVGAIVANMHKGAILNSTVSGNVVSTTSNIGGFIGTTDASELLTIKDCINNASIVGSFSNVGGFIGNASSAVTFKSSTNNGQVVAQYYNAGGFVGNAKSEGYSSTLVQTAYDKQNNEISLVVGNKKKDSFYTINLKKLDATANTETLLDGSEFTICDKDKNPIAGLENIKLINGKLKLDEVEMLDVGTDVYYLKETKAPKGYELIEEYIKLEINKKWDGVNSEFIVSVNGQDSSSSDDTQIESGKTHTGETNHFNATDDVKWLINKVGIVDCENNGTIISTRENAAGFIGKVTGTATIDNSVNKGEIHAANHLAGFVAEALYANDEEDVVEITNCKNEGLIVAVSGPTKVVCKDAAGIISYAKVNTIVIGSTNEGTITAMDSTRADYTAGGIVGNAVNTLGVSLCNNKGTITANEIAGGIVGKGFNENKNISLNQNENNGEINSKGTVGGVIGLSVNQRLDINDCVNKSAKINKISGSIGNLGGIVGHTSSALRMKNCKSIDVETSSVDMNVHDSAMVGAVTSIVDRIDTNKKYYPSIVDIEDCFVENTKMLGIAQTKGGIIGGILSGDVIAEVNIKNCVGTDFVCSDIDVNGNGPITGFAIGYMSKVLKLEVNNCNVKNMVAETNASGGSIGGMIGRFDDTGNTDVRHFNVLNCSVDGINIKSQGDNSGGLIGFGLFNYAEINIENNKVTGVKMNSNGVSSAGILGQFNGNSVSNEVTFNYINNEVSDIESVAIGIKDLGGHIGILINIKNVNLLNNKISNANITTGGDNHAADFVSTIYGNGNVVIDGVDITNASIIKSSTVSAAPKSGALSAQIANCKLVDLKNIRVKGNSDIDRMVIDGGCHVGALLGQILNCVTVENITLENIDVNGWNSEQIGGFAGLIDSSYGVSGLDNINIKNVSIEVKESNNCGAGIIAGHSNHFIGINKSNIENIEVINGIDSTGGLIGIACQGLDVNNSNIDGVLVSCKANTHMIGGLVGETRYADNKFKIQNSTINNIEVEDTDNPLGTKYVAGILGFGRLEMDNTNVTNITVDGLHHAAGLVGFGNLYINQNTDTINNIKTIKVKTNVTQGNSTLTTFTGGLAGLINSNLVMKNLNISNIDVTNSNIMNDVGGLVAQEMSSNAEIYTNVNVSDINVHANANSNENDSRQFQVVGGLFGMINNPGKLKGMNIDDIHVDGRDAFAGIVFGMNVGYSTANVEGITLKNSSINMDSYKDIGGIIGNTTVNISDVNVINSQITNTHGHVGGIVGYSNKNITNCNVTNSTIKGTADDAYGLGGIIGHGFNISQTNWGTAQPTTSVSNCVVTDSKMIGQKAVGGIAGAAVPTITECSVIGTKKVAVINNVSAQGSIEEKVIKEEMVEKVEKSEDDLEEKEASKEVVVEKVEKTESEAELEVKDTETKDEIEDKEQIEDSEEVKEEKSEEMKDELIEIKEVQNVASYAVGNVGDNDSIEIIDNEDTSKLDDVKDEEEDLDCEEDMDNLIGEESKEIIEENKEETKEDSKSNCVVTKLTEENKANLVKEEEEEYLTIVSGHQYVGGIIGFGGIIESPYHLPVTLTDCKIQNIKVEGDLVMIKNSDTTKPDIDDSGVSQDIGKNSTKSSSMSDYPGEINDSIFGFINEFSVVKIRSDN